MPVPRPRRDGARTLFPVVVAARAGTVSVTTLIRSVSSATRPVRHSSELLNVNVGGEQVVLGSNLLQARRGGASVQRIRRRQVHHIVRKTVTGLRVGSPVVGVGFSGEGSGGGAVTAAADEQVGRGRGRHGIGISVWVRRWILHLCGHSLLCVSPIETRSTICLSLSLSSRSSSSRCNKILTILILIFIIVFIIQYFLIQPPSLDIKTF